MWNDGMCEVRSAFVLFLMICDADPIIVEKNPLSMGTQVDFETHLPFSLHPLYN
jgi:hypothetical protein